MQDQQVEDGSLRGEYAGFVTRLVALLCDITLLAAIVLALGVSVQAVLGFVLDRLTFSQDAGAVVRDVATAGFAAFSLLLPPVYTVFFWTIIGQTPGKMLLGVRVVRPDGGPVTLARAVVRYAAYFVSAFLLLGFLWVLVDNRRQGWHDKLARTVVIYVWEGERGVAFRRLRQVRARVRAPGRDPQQRA